MKVVALIPMKKTSERVPNKNLKLFDGAPLYHAVMKQLLASRHISEIVVNTDSNDLRLDIEANFERVIVRDRPEAIRGNDVSMNKIIFDDISNFDADIYVQAHSTSPLLLIETLDLAIDHYIENSDKVDSLFTVTDLRVRLYDESGVALNHNPDELKRTQDLDPVYEENSCFYIFTKESFCKSGNNRIGLHPEMYVIDKLQAMDIDEPEDFLIAESAYKMVRC